MAPVSPVGPTKPLFPAPGAPVAPMAPVAPVAPVAPPPTETFRERTPVTESIYTTLSANKTGKFRIADIVTSEEVDLAETEAPVVILLTDKSFGTFPKL
jgi:hypothetical protein